MDSNEPIERLAHTPETLARALNTQLRLLATSALMFDQGHVEQSLTMATQLRVLLHDYQQPGKRASSTSVLKLVGFKDRLRFLDTHVANMPSVMGGPAITMEVEYEDGTRELKPMGHSGLVGIDGSGPVPVYCAPLDRQLFHRNRRSFRPWWEQPVMSFPGKLYSRWDLVRQMSNVAGGAHLDPRGLEASYARFVEDGVDVWIGNDASKFADIDGGGTKPQGDPAAASMRQIVYEVTTTIDASSELQQWLNNPV